MNELIKGSSIVFLFKVIGAIALFLINIIISNVYGAKYLGIYALLMAMLKVGSIASKAGLDVYIIRILPTLEDKKRIGSYLFKVLIRILLLAVIVSLLLILGRSVVNEYLFRSINANEYILFGAFLIIPYTLYTMIPEVLRGFNEIKLYSIIRNGLLSLLILASLGIMIFYESTDPTFALYYGVIGSFLVATAILIPFLKRRAVVFSSLLEYKKPILKKSYPMFLTASMFFLMGNVDSFMIGYFENETQVGLFNACVRLSFMITFILGAINSYISPQISKYYHEADFKNLKKIYYQSLKLIWIIVLPVFLILYLFPSFFLGLFGDEFIQAKFTLLILNTAYLTNAVFGPIGYVLNMTDNQKPFMYIISFGLIINVIGNIILIPLAGIEGAAISTLISMGLWNLVSFIKTKRLKLI